jgi:TRAP-type C4-dicarboxylate transport system permease small subunit
LFDNPSGSLTSLWNLPQNGGKFRRFYRETVSEIVQKLRSLNNSIIICGGFTVFTIIRRNAGVVVSKQPRRCGAVSAVSWRNLMLDRIENKICFCLKVLMAALLFVMVLINVLQVTTRYFISMTITWVEEFSILGIIWMAALGIPLAWFAQSHLSMDITARIYPEWLKKALWWLCQIVCVVASIGFIVVGMSAYKINKGLIASMEGYDEAVRYVPLIVCGFLLLTAAIFKMVEEWLVLKNKKEGA